jgi:hypothetical protein
MLLPVVVSAYDPMISGLLADTSNDALGNSTSSG